MNSTGRSSRVIMVYWKNRTKKPYEVYSNLKKFCTLHPDYNYHALTNRLSRQGVPYETGSIRIERLTVNDN